MRSDDAISHRHAVGLWITLAAIVLLFGLGALAAATPKHLTVLYTNDTLGNFEPCG